MCYVRPPSNVLFRPQPQPSKFEITCIKMERNTYTVGRKLKSLRPCWKIFDVLGVNPIPKFKMSTFLNFNYYLTSWAFEVSKSAQCTHSQVIASQACLFYFKSRVLRSKTSWNKSHTLKEKQNKLKQELYFKREAKQAETRLLISDCVWYLIHGTTCYFWKLFSPTALQRNIARYQITLVAAQGSGLSQTTDQSVILRLLFQDCL